MTSSPVLKWIETVAPGEELHVRRLTLHPGQRVSEHGHDFSEVLFASRGEGVHRVNGTSFPLAAGALWWIRPGDFHELVPGPQSLEITNVAFSQSLFGGLISRYPAELGALVSLEAGPVQHQLPEVGVHRLNRAAEELARSPRRAFFVERFLMNLVLEVRPPHFEGLPPEAPDWLLAACHEFSRPGNLARGVPQLVDRCGYSREHVARAFRRWLNTTPTAWLNRLRLFHAGQMLAMSEQSILQISQDCGFANLSHFYQLFGAQFGVTPRQYRLAHRRAL